MVIQGDLIPSIPMGHMTFQYGKYDPTIQVSHYPQYIYIYNPTIITPWYSKLLDNTFHIGIKKTQLIVGPPMIFHCCPGVAMFEAQIAGRAAGAAGRTAGSAAATGTGLSTRSGSWIRWVSPKMGGHPGLQNGNRRNVWISNFCSLSLSLSLSLPVSLPLCLCNGKFSCDPWCSYKPRWSGVTGIWWCGAGQTWFHAKSYP